ncbi:MAG: hypothetical protein IJF07_06960, partial [Lachnospiraceae bacterium]|nr:hypothetical protein [Lachnospiraceae bacterium]
MKKEYRLRGSLLAKLAAFFILAISFMLGVVALMITSLFVDQNVYYYQSTQAATQVLARELMVNHAWEEMHEFRDWYFNGGEKKVGENYVIDRNFSIELYKEDELCWGNYSGEETPYSFTYIFEEWVLNEKTEANGQPKYTTKEFICYLYVDNSFPYDDEYCMAYNHAVYLCELRYIVPVVAVVAFVTCLICFIFLMCSSGYQKRKDELSPSILAPLHLDVLTLVFGGITLMGLILFFESINGSTIFGLVAGVVIATILLAWDTIYCMEFALRLKMGHWWKHTLCYVLIRIIWRVLRFVGKGMITVVKGIPLVLNTAIVYCGICIIEFIGLCLWSRYSELVIMWFLEKVVLLFVVLYVALVCKRLLEGSAALAEGDLSYKIDTSKMFLDFKEHGENLNQIGQGIAKAVNERMKSEHLKTELITNVSHDLKTPLTSIINYADLLGNMAALEEGMEKEKVAEYSEVLLRQSKRLKKLLD